MAAIFRDAFDIMPKAKHSAARAAVIAAVVMDHSVLVVRAGGNARIREEFDAAVALAEAEFPSHIEKIYRAYGEQRITFDRGGEVLFASDGINGVILGRTFDMILEAKA